MKIDLKELQKEIIRNKVEKGFNTKDVPLEFCFAQTELAEGFIKYIRGKDGTAEELADAAIFILGLCEILGYDLGDEILKKVEKNKGRVYDKAVSPDGRSVVQRVRTPDDP